MKTPVRAKWRFFGAAICKLGGGFLFFYQLNHLLTSLSFLKKPLLIGWLLIAAIGAQAATYYVSPLGSDANNGTSWALAKRTIQAGINVATSGDTILVADGTYMLTSQISISPGVIVRSVNGAQATTINGGGVTRCAYLNTDAVLDGFTVTRGYSDVGGGVYVSGGTVQNCTISESSATYGGGVAIGCGTVQNCMISGNTADDNFGPYDIHAKGGGVFVYGGTIQNCTIIGNTADGSMPFGGGVFADGGMVQNCMIIGNTCHYGGGGVWLWSGGTVQNCTISGNTSSYFGAGVQIWYGGTVQNCMISGNTAYGNSGLHDIHAKGGGGFGGYGGGVQIWDDGTVQNCMISGNTACYGGGVHVWSDGTVENCTISGNSASRGGFGGVYVADGTVRGTVRNCIVYYNQNGDIFGPISYSCVGVSNNIAGVGNITDVPQFVSIGTGYGANHVPGNYRLRSSSPCINAGINQSWMTSATDLDGLLRILGGVVDMGTYECVGTNSAIMRNPTILLNQCDYGSNATGQTIQVWNAGMGAMAYALSANVDWLSLSPASGTSTGETDLVSVNYASAGLAPGTYIGIVTITSAEAINSPQVVTVYLWVDHDIHGEADLEVSDLKFVPVNLWAGDHPAMISFDLVNDGPEDIVAPDAPLEITFYLSSNMTFGDEDDLAIGTKTETLTLLAGSQTTIRYPGRSHNTDVTIPEGLSGDYYVFVSVRLVSQSGLSDPDGAYAMRDGPIRVRIHPVVNDYDGDGQSDMMVYDEASGEWAIRLSESGEWVRFIFGGPGYETVPGDYDGDFKVDPAVHHKKGSQWDIMLSGIEYQTISFDFGGEGETKGAVGDYNGDGLADPGLYEEVSGRWYLLLPNTEHGNYEMASVVLGGLGYTPVAGDYDGDGCTDPAVYEEATGNWLVMLSAQGYGVVSADLGGPGYRPVPGDYDGDGKADLAIMSASGGWYYRLSSHGYSLSGPDAFGVSGNPVPGDYDGDGKSDPAMMDSSGNWYFWLSGS